LTLAGTEQRADHVRTEVTALRMPRLVDRAVDAFIAHEIARKVS
jgi:hypothetical protein